jgi:hypothetical protein
MSYEIGTKPAISHGTYALPYIPICCPPGPMNGEPMPVGRIMYGLYYMPGIPGYIGLMFGML